MLILPRFVTYSEYDYFQLWHSNNVTTFWEEYIQYITHYVNAAISTFIFSDFKFYDDFVYDLEELYNDLYTILEYFLEWVSYHHSLNPFYISRLHILNDLLERVELFSIAELDILCSSKQSVIYDAKHRAVGVDS